MQPSRIMIWLFRLVAAVWLAAFIPIAVLNLALLEIPFWPGFDAKTTVGDVALWAVATASFYITPVVLLVVGRRWNR